MRYLKEIAKAVRDGKHLPGPIPLMRQYARWRKFQENKDIFRNGMPWITFSAMDFLNGYLNSTMNVFEYGGGGSSIFFSSRVKNLVTVEHNKEWFEGLTKEMSKGKKATWKGYFIEGEIAQHTENLSTSNPNDYYSADDQSRHKTYRKYASAIDEFDDEYFDVVLIDGRARPSCMKHSMRKVRKGGLLILDNADRSYYLATIGNPPGYKLISDIYGPLPYVSWFSQTNIWSRM